MSLCVHVHTTNITYFFRRDNVLFMSLCRYVTSVYKLSRREKDVMFVV